MADKRIRVFAPPDWQRAFEEAATKAGKSVSEWLRDCGHDSLPKKVQAGLSEVRGVGRPKTKGDDNDANG